jgi:hypothetical protein
MLFHFCCQFSGDRSPSSLASLAKVKVSRPPFSSPAAFSWAACASWAASAVTSIPIASPTTSRRLTGLDSEACQSMLPLVSMMAIGSRGTPGFRTGLRSLMLGSSMRFPIGYVVTLLEAPDCSDARLASTGPWAVGAG